MSTWLLLAIAGAAQPAMAQEPPADPGEAAHAHAEELNRRAVELLRAGRPDEAAPLARMAYHLEPSHEIASNLGVAELRVGLFRKAAEHLSHALRLLPPNAGPDARQRIVQSLAKAKAEVCELTIRVNVEGAEIAIGVVPVGRSPLPATVFADPGTHVIEATLDGYTPGRREVTVTKGQALELSLTLGEPREAAPRPRPASKAPSELQEEPPAPDEPAVDAKLIVAGSGVAAVGVGAGIALLVVSSSLDTEAMALQAELGRSGCYLPPAELAGPCNDLQRLINARDQTHDFGFAALAFAGFIAGATVAYGVWPGLAEPQRSASAVVLPAWSPESGGFVVAGRW